MGCKWYNASRQDVVSIPPALTNQQREALPMAKKLISDYDRFFQRILQLPSGCWEWQLAPDKDGYGLFSVGSATNGTARRVRAARWAYIEFVGEIADGLVIDHLCRNRICVNPAHLEPVTQLINTQEKRARD
jgi:hypothetical protein